MGNSDDVLERLIGDGDFIDRLADKVAEKILMRQASELAERIGSLGCSSRHGSLHSGRIGTLPTDDCLRGGAEMGGGSAVNAHRQAAEGFRDIARTASTDWLARCAQASWKWLLAKEEEEKARAAWILSLQGRGKPSHPGSSE